ncbi:DUF1552 domain-containing protein [Oligoflexus tunisiensis]|uniref:DUF1552 domain-containing protein n=1 Tax=Oligoflexus tunisiensis TaxID=708132 RepID=UPI00114C9E11|nr:DUF1552 domain-containing protein [Oligoflexus tunisiensis]
MSQHLRLSRRSILKSIGGLAVSLPLARSLAMAQSETTNGPFKRVVFICGESGASSLWWRPRGGEKDFDIEFDGAVLKPLAPLRSKLLILNGVGNFAAAFGVENHEARATTFTAWANSKPGEPNFARGPSVDRAIIRELQETRPLYAAIGGDGGPGSEYYYAGPGYPIGAVGTPIRIFNALFADYNPPPQNTEELALQEFRRSLLQQQVADASLLRQRLGSEAQARLDQYLMTLQGHLDSLTLKPVPLPPIPTPMKPARNPDYKTPIPITGPYDLYTRDLDLIADGLILGLTQVACLKIHHGIVEDGFVGKPVDTYDPNGTKMGSMLISDYHQHVAHAQLVGDRFSNLSPNLMARDVHTVVAKAVARFLMRLDAVREVDGSTVLDNTLVVWTTQMGDQATHFSGRLPYVLAGGLGEKMGTFKMGRFVDYVPGGIQGAAELRAMNCAVPHHLLLNSIQRTFGVQQDIFGENLDPSRCMGYLPRATG